MLQGLKAPKESCRFWHDPSKLRVNAFETQGKLKSCPPWRDFGARCCRIFGEQRAALRKRLRKNDAIAFVDANFLRVASADGVANPKRFVSAVRGIAAHGAVVYRKFETAVTDERAQDSGDIAAAVAFAVGGAEDGQAAGVAGAVAGMISVMISGIIRVMIA